MSEWTAEEVALWLQTHPAEATVLVFQFLLGCSVGTLLAAGQSEDAVRQCFEAGLRGMPKPKVEVPS